MFASRSIQAIAILVLAMILAVWLGVAIVTNQFETLIQIGGAALLLTALFLGRKVWLLFIFMASANVVLFRWFGSTDIGQVIFISFSAMLFLMRKLKFQISFTELELWMVLIAGCILQAYFRNPVGMNILGSGNVGGRPYFVLALWFATSLLLSTLIVSPQELKWAVWASIGGGLLGIPLQILRYGDVTSGAGEGRVPAMGTCSTILAKWLSSEISPLRACFRPTWAILLLVVLAMAAASGYRNSIAGIGMIFCIGILYHSGISAFLASLLLLSCGLGVLAFVNLVSPLPGSMQRALSPLPGTWEQRYRQMGEDSTEWRIEMWKEALFTDRWIQNKLLGDGIGISAAQLEQNLNLDAANVGMMGSGLSRQQENMLIVGSYHSGPVHSVRMVGYVGLIILLLAMFRLAVHTHRQIMRTRSTEWFPVALFFGIPLITQPFFFVFVFGEYHTGVAQTLFGIATIRLLERNLPLPAWQSRNCQVNLLQTAPQIELTAPPNR